MLVPLREKEKHEKEQYLSITSVHEYRSSDILLVNPVSC